GGGGPLLGGGAERHQDDKTEQQAERGQRAGNHLHPSLPFTTASAGWPSTPLRSPTVGFRLSVAHRMPSATGVPIQFRMEFLPNRDKCYLLSGQSNRSADSQPINNECRSG